MALKADCVLRALTNKLESALGPGPMRRFIPYIQMYEFEGLLFSHPENLACGINQDALQPQFQKIRDAFGSPEEINDSAATAPSKRIERLYSAYDKPVHGSLAAMEIGLDVIRQECHRFDSWLKTLEALRRPA